MTMTTANYKGDVRLVIDNDGDFDINLQNGQPEMTEFIDTLSYLYLFGVDSWYNEIVTEESEKMKSRFPEFIKTANVSDETIAEGRIYIIEALQPLVDQNIAKKIDADGDIVSVYAIQWVIEIERFDGQNSKYSLTWEKGFVKLESLTNGTN